MILWWFQEWLEEDYPPYANGPGYILSSDVAHFVVSEFESHRLRVRDTEFEKHIFCHTLHKLFFGLCIYASPPPPMKNLDFVDDCTLAYFYLFICFC